MMTSIYHVSSLRWGGEDTLTLVPGAQCAEGRGVYFSEDEPRFSAAEGIQQAGAGAIFLISVRSPKGWWRTKKCNCRNRPRTWHTAGKEITLSGLHKVGEINATPVVAGEWRIKWATDLGIKRILTRERAGGDRWAYAAEYTGDEQHDCCQRVKERHLLRVWREE